MTADRAAGVSGARTFPALDNGTVEEALAGEVDPATCLHPFRAQVARLTDPEGAVTTVLRCPPCGHEVTWFDPPSGVTS